MVVLLNRQTSYLGGQSSRKHRENYASRKARHVCHSGLSTELLVLSVAYDMAEAIQVQLMLAGKDFPIELAPDGKQRFDAASCSAILKEKLHIVHLMVSREGLATLRIEQILHVPRKSNVADALIKPCAGLLGTGSSPNGPLNTRVATQMCMKL
ncbi:hypothetical protein FVE85_8809 [Porphyridium purpureum]|uniref:Uncharacterized protein n=1 Tax=Porphyridium purpureum TaxID=35688 RepID=A0A5J4YRL3_PORPP|nr:hypothetical protein FVE85_8809 [Porphyridium purpureum]|eukprot:POR3618..scf296_7